MRVDPILLDFPDEFESARLTIRSPRPGDGPALRDALADSLEELRIWLPWADGPLPTEEECEKSVREAHVQFLSRQDLRLHLYLRGTNIQVGGSGLHRIDWNVPKFEIGYWLRTPHVGRGLMTEAVAAITQFAFNELGRGGLRSNVIPEMFAVLRYRLALVIRLKARSEMRFSIPLQESCVTRRYSRELIKIWSDFSLFLGVLRGRRYNSLRLI